METVTIDGHEFDFDVVINLMDDELREHLHMLLDEFDGRGSTAQQFVDDYCVLHREKFGADFVVN